MMVIRLCLRIALTTILITLVACGETQKPNDSPENQKALAEIRKETKVKEAIITEANVLYVSVDDDLTKRDGYAQYICEVLRESNATVSAVKVVAHGTTNSPNSDNAYGVLLGESACE